MRKKWLAAGAVLAVGFVMFSVSVFSASASAAGYEVYKAALERTKGAKSLTADVDVRITDHGKKVFSGRAKVKLNKEMKAGNVEAVFQDGTEGAKGRVRQVFWQDGKVIFKEGDEEIYRWLEHPKGEKGKEGPPKAARFIANALLRSVREDMTVEKGPDGGKRVELALSEQRIPSFVNGIGRIAMTKASRSRPRGPESGCMAEIPVLTKAIRVEEMDFTADITPTNRLQQQTVRVRMTGRDDAGKHHELTLQIRARFSGMNQTDPKRIDLAGKKAVKMEWDRMKFGRHH